MAMQALQPRIKEIQERYKGKPQDEMQARALPLHLGTLPFCMHECCASQQGRGVRDEQRRNVP